eukprot:TRINITY_DN6765_c0_g1_i1.p1 TRINITY_DN6765_c0_g1~~TRINITY_DN6765_c0_g1_i1.p1  ORF type:complete len:185 (-),score=43.70 TRINITY_DN6765_c0_g1_i1:184-738(-)
MDRSCKKCNCEIDGGTEYFEAFGHKFHKVKPGVIKPGTSASCFQCFACAKDLSSATVFYNNNSTPTCEVCFSKKYPSKSGDGRYKARPQVKRMPKGDSGSSDAPKPLSKSTAAAPAPVQKPPPPMIPNRRTYQDEDRNANRGGGGGQSSPANNGISGQAFKFCPECGEKSDIQQRFCGVCGNSM